MSFHYNKLLHMEYKLVQKYVHLIIVISIIREEILEDYTI